MASNAAVIPDSAIKRFIACSFLRVGANMRLSRTRFDRGRIAGFVVRNSE
jgi:hypothetical protein